MTKKQEIRYICAAAVVFGLFLFCALWFTVEGPMTDDAQIVIGSVAGFLQADNWPEKFHFLAEQNAEHRILTTRLMALISIQLFGFISIQFLVALGTLIIAAIACLLYRDARRENAVNPADLLILSLILLCPAYWASISAGWGTSNFGSVLYTYLAILCLNRNTVRGFVCFECLMAIAIFTQTNGWFAAPFGVIALILNRHRAMKWMLVIHLLISALLYRLYFFHYDHHDEYYALAENTAWADPIKAIYLYVRWVSAWLGQWIMPVGFQHPHTALAVELSVITGLAMIAFTVIYGFKNRQILYTRCRNRLWLLLFVFASVAIGSLARSQLAEVKYALSGRYAFYSLCFLALLYSLTSSVKQIKNQTGSFHRIALTAAFIYGACIYTSTFPELQKERKQRHMCVRLWNSKQEAKPCYWHGDNGADMKQADSLGVLRIDYGIFGK
jgi:hypothetical protein